jgi:hypothetical protein
MPNPGVKKALDPVSVSVTLVINNELDHVKVRICKIILIRFGWLWMFVTLISNGNCHVRNLGTSTCKCEHPFFVSVPCSHVRSYYCELDRKSSVPGL